MKLKLLTLFFLLFSVPVLAQESPLKNATYFELRIYTAHEGKLPDLINRFKNHTMGLFEKAGMTNVAYFEPVENDENKLYYILGYPDKASRDRMWQIFLNDPDWKAAYEKSRENGPLVAKIEEQFMTLASGLNEGDFNKKSGVFQLRTYFCFDGKIDDIQKRFKDHTQALFEKQGLINYPYFLTEENDGSQPKLVYLLGHRDRGQFDQAFDNFRKDPDWIKARDASEENGKIVERVDAVYLKALPFSPMK
jgi:NIPSNAP.